MSAIREKAAWAIAAGLGLLVIASVSGVVSGGPLDPTDAPGPTMKTLEQVEPRTPISSLPVTISAPGSYYLTGNLTGGASQDGIIVSASNVTIDLNGFTLKGGATSFAGIITYSAPVNVRIVNGIVDSFPSGQIRMSAASRVTLDRLTVVDVGTSTAVELGAESLVTNCVVDANLVGRGLEVGVQSIVSGCVVRGGVQGIFTAGGPNSAVRDCNVRGSGLSGVHAGIGTAVEGCTVSGVESNGIRADGRNMISGNHIEGNGTEIGGIGCGVFVAGADSGIYQNQITNNDRAVCFTAGVPGNTAHGNVLRGNTLGSFSDIGTNDVGPEQTAATGTSPWANIVIP